MGEENRDVNTFLHNNRTLTHKPSPCIWRSMDERNQLMEQVRQRTFAARMSLYALCKEAGVSGTVITRWIQKKNTPSLPTIGKLEKKLDAIEQERPS